MKSNLPLGVTIGYAGEQFARRILFDVSKEMECWPNSAPSLLYIRPGESTPYLAAITVEGTNVVWEPDTFAMEKEGSSGSLQLLFTTPGTTLIIGKSHIIRLYVNKSIPAGEDAPEAYETWLASLTDLAAQTYLNAQAASNSATSAAESADAVAEMASDSEAYAKGTRNGVAIDSTDPAYQNNSLYFRDQASNLATNAANSATAAANSASSAAEHDQNAANSAEQAANSASSAEASSASAHASADLAVEATANVSDAEAYAKGTRNGTPVSYGDPAFHNNTKYYSERAASSASTASSYATDSEAYAKGTRNGVAVTSRDVTYRNNSKYYSDQAQYMALIAEDIAAEVSDTADALAVAAENHGVLYFSIDDNGHLVSRYTDGAESIALAFSISNGRLVMSL